MTTETQPAAPSKPTEKQIRYLVVLMNEHGLTDRADAMEWLSVLTDREITSRKDLSFTEAQAAIDALLNAPRRPTPALLSALARPFPEEHIGKLARVTCKACRDSQRKVCDEHTWLWDCDECRGRHSSAAIHLDYVGHADITARLNEVDPLWTWEPFSQEQIMALPPKLRDAGLWINLTILGHTRPGFGDADGKSGGNAVKEMIGDALRNGAMRFGVALELWAKGDRARFRADVDEEVASQPATGYEGWPMIDLLTELDRLADDKGMTRESITAPFRKHNSDMPVEQIPELPPEVLGGLLARLRDWNPPTR